MLRFTANPPLSLYVHVPWCVRKCPYCDFNSHALADALPEQAYIDALLTDLEGQLPDIWGRPVASIFIGGGTPSLLSAATVQQLLSGLRARLCLPADAEITLEANPGAIEGERFAAFRAAGINRLSIGVQSFNDAHLQRLGRIHDRQEALHAVAQARSAGFDNINLDLMFGLPGQSPQQAREDLDTALSLQPEHLSYYQLTLEPNTAFHRFPPALPKEDAVLQMQRQGRQTLADAGFEHYEVSAHARPGRRCRHNLNYWQFGDYLGIGAGAHGKLTQAAHGRILRRHKRRHPQDYLRAPQAHAGEQAVSRDDLAFEFMLNALRLTDGFDSHLFEQRTGLSIHTIVATLQTAEQQGLLSWDVQNIRPTARGQDFLNDLIGMFLPG